MKTITICDDHPIVREGIKQLIQTLGNYKILDDLDSGEALMKSLRRQKPEMVILDVSLPGRNGLEVLKDIKSFYPEIKVLILSMYPEDQFAIRMIKAGASGYLHKDSKPEILSEALKRISNGEEYVSPSLTKLLFDAMHNDPDNLPHVKLSDREYAVFLELGEGTTLSEIADKLNLSVKTISTYRSRILDKMEMSKNSDIVKYIINHNLSISSLDG